MADFDDSLPPGAFPQQQQAAADAEDEQLNLEMDEDTAEGTYANLVMIAHSPEEFILDFIRMVPGVQKARVKSRIIVTPQHAVRLMNALAENVERYEQAHGPIREPGEDGGGGFQGGSGEGGGGLPPMGFGGGAEA
jgi:hypothetical protein